MFLINHNIILSFKQAYEWKNTAFPAIYVKHWKEENELYISQGH